jgi:hypothetical protein
VTFLPAPFGLAVANDDDPLRSVGPSFHDARL